MYYEKMMKAMEIMMKNCTSTEELDRVIKGGIIDALFYIANELHELNTALRAGVDDGR